MKYYEMRIYTYLKNNLEQKYAQEIVANLIKYCSNNNSYLSEQHMSSKLKNNCCSCLYPTFKDMIYKKDEVYFFIVRSNDKEYISNLDKEIRKQNNEWFAILKTEIKEYNQRHILEIQTYTPTILTLKEYEIPNFLKDVKSRNKYWVDKCSKKLLIDRIENNLIKKYKTIYGEDIKDVSMIKSIEVRNKYPIVIKYKKSCLVGNQLNIKINSDEKSQKLAHLSLITGILEKNNSLCCGFAKGVYL